VAESRDRPFGKAHLIVVDYYSRYPEVAELRNTKARTVISKTKSIFSRHGILDEVLSDNGPQYSSQEYQQFAKDYDFTHTTISPRYPQSGGLREKTVQTVKADFQLRVFLRTSTHVKF
jgi:transposase InsO family protein